MHLKRFTDASAYEAPNHFGCYGLRLQGFEENGPKNQWIGFSQFFPGGGAGPDSTPFEKVYIMIEGEMTLDHRWRGDSPQTFRLVRHSAR